MYKKNMYIHIYGFFTRAYAGLCRGLESRIKKIVVKEMETTIWVLGRVFRHWDRIG